jgi:hypothetical protein
MHHIILLVSNIHIDICQKMRLNGRFIKLAPEGPGCTID